MTTETDATKTFKDDAEERCQEKIVYKIIPVPYYYPVPCDADWYNKNYEKQFKPNDYTRFPFVDTSVEHHVPPPPPGFPYPGFRHPNRHFVYEPSREPITTPPPPPSSNAERQNATSPLKGPGRSTYESENTSAADTGSIATTPTTETPNKASNGDKPPNYDEIVIKTEEIDDEDFDSITVIVNGVSESPKKVNPDTIIEQRKDIESVLSTSKRPTMTFPYDQNKKTKLSNGLAEKRKPPKQVIYDPPRHVADVNVTPTKTPEMTDGHYTLVPNHHAVPVSGLQAIPAGAPPGYSGIQGIHGVPMMIPQAMPYVVVPMQNPAFRLHQPTIVHQPNMTGVVEHRPLAPPPPYHLPPHSTVDPTVLGSELQDLKADMVNWEKEPPKEAADPNDVKYHHNGRRVRTVFTRHQSITLNSIFKKQNFISGKRMRELSDELGLDRKTVKIWFQNKRQYLRKKASPHSGFERDEDYLMYRDIPASEIIRPPTMTSMANDSYNSVEENLNIMDTDNFVMGDENSENDGEVNDDVGIIDDNEMIDEQEIDNEDTGSNERGEGNKDNANEINEEDISPASFSECDVINQDDVEENIANEEGMASENGEKEEANENVSEEEHSVVINEQNEIIEQNEINEEDNDGDEMKEDENTESDGGENNSGEGDDEDVLQ